MTNNTSNIYVKQKYMCYPKRPVWTDDYRTKPSHVTHSYYKECNTNTLFSEIYKKL